MSEHDQSRKVAAIANETLEKGKVASEQSVRAIEQSYSVMVENIRAFNVKMIDMARTNTETAFDLARQIATARAPSDVFAIWTTYAPKLFETLSAQAKELTALGQKMAGESAEPITRSANQAFKKAS